MPFSTIATPEARPVANYKMATRLEGGRLLYISGQVAWDASGAIVGKGDVRAQARQTFQNLRGVVQAAGGDLADLMKITACITRIEDFPAVAEARSEVFRRAAGQHLDRGQEPLSPGFPDRGGGRRRRVTERSGRRSAMAAQQPYRALLKRLSSSSPNWSATWTRSSTQSRAWVSVMTVS